MAIPKITPEDTKYLDSRYTLFKKHTRYAGWSAAAASFLLIGALIVIGCASLCFTLPGVNAVQQIVLPAYLPAGGAILLSLPLIFITVKNKRESNYYRKETVNRILHLLKKYNVALLSKDRKKNTERAASFIEKNILTKRYQSQFYSKLLRDLIKTFPDGKKEKRTKEDKRLVKALEKCVEKLNK